MKTLISIVVLIFIAWLVIWMVRRAPDVDLTGQETGTSGTVESASTGPDDDTQDVGEYQDKG